MRATTTTTASTTAVPQTAADAAGILTKRPVVALTGIELRLLRFDSFNYYGVAFET